MVTLPASVSVYYVFPVSIGNNKDDGRSCIYRITQRERETDRHTESDRQTETDSDRDRETETKVGKQRDRSRKTNRCSFRRVYCTLQFLVYHVR